MNDLPACGAELPETTMEQVACGRKPLRQSLESASWGPAWGVGGLEANRRYSALGGARNVRQLGSLN